jgi:DNA repair exonuclease SbcCD ATPase subunit
MTDTTERIEAIRKEYAKWPPDMCEDITILLAALDRLQAENATLRAKLAGKEEALEVYVSEHAVLKAKLAEAERALLAEDAKVFDLREQLIANGRALTEARADLEAERAAHNTLRAEVDADLAAFNAGCQDGHTLIKFAAEHIDACPVCEARAEAETWKRAAETTGALGARATENLDRAEAVLREAKIAMTFTGNTRTPERILTEVSEAIDAYFTPTQHKDTDQA